MKPGEGLGVGGEGGEVNSLINSEPVKMEGLCEKWL